MGDTIVAMQDYYDDIHTKALFPKNDVNECLYVLQGELSDDAKQIQDSSKKKDPLVKKLLEELGEITKCRLNKASSDNKRREKKLQQVSLQSRTSQAVSSKLSSRLSENSSIGVKL